MYQARLHRTAPILGVSASHRSSHLWMIARDHRSRNNFETGNFDKQYRPRCTSTLPTPNHDRRHLPLAVLFLPRFYQNDHGGLAFILAHILDELPNSSPRLAEAQNGGAEVIE